MQPAAWVAIGHGTSASGNQHIHIGASLVRMDGRRVNIWQDRRTLSRVCAEIEHDYGLTVVEGREGKGMPGLSRAELERTATEQLAEPPRITLARLVREASVASKDEAEFVRRLRGSGVLVRPRFETGGQHTVVGYSVALRTTSRRDADLVRRGEAGQGPDLAAPSPVLAGIKERSQGSRRRMERRQVGCPGQRGAPRSPRGLETGGGKCREVARTVEGRAGIGSRRLAWGGTGSRRACLLPGRDAWRGAGLVLWRQQLTHWLDRRRADPVSRRPTREAVRDFRGVAAIVAQSQLSRDSSMAWAMLIDQMGRTLRAIGDAHAARGEFIWAKVLVDTLSAEIAVLHERFETKSTQELAPGERVHEGRFDPAMSKKLPHQAKHHRGRGQSQGHGAGR